MIGVPTAAPAIRHLGNDFVIHTFPAKITWLLSKCDENLEESNIYNIVTWSTNRDEYINYIKPGHHILIDGRLQTNYSNEDRNTSKHTEILATNIKFLNRSKNNYSDYQITSATLSNNVPPQNEICDSSQFILGMEVFNRETKKTETKPQK